MGFPVQCMIWCVFRSNEQVNIMATWSDSANLSSMYSFDSADLSSSLCIHNYRRFVLNRFSLQCYTSNNTNSWNRLIKLNGSKIGTNRKSTLHNNFECTKSINCVVQLARCHGGATIFTRSWFQIEDCQKHRLKALCLSLSCNIRTQIVMEIIG